MDFHNAVSIYIYSNIPFPCNTLSSTLPALASYPLAQNLWAYLKTFPQAWHWNPFVGQSHIRLHNLDKKTLHSPLIRPPRPSCVFILSKYYYGTKKMGCVVQASGLTYSFLSWLYNSFLLYFLQTVAYFPSWSPCPPRPWHCLLSPRFTTHSPSSVRHINGRSAGRTFRL